MGILNFDAKQATELTMKFDNVFETGQLEEQIDERKLCAAALCAWANCAAGAEIPKNFGKGMAAISEKLGMAAIPDNLEKYAIRKGWLSDDF